MPLELYAGPVARYLTGDYDPDGAPRPTGQPSDEDLAELAEARAEGWRTKLNKLLVGKIAEPLAWIEGRSRPYLALRPAPRARDGLALWAAYLSRRDLKRPAALPDRLDADPAYAEATEKGYYLGAMAVFECQVFAPSTENFIVQAEHPAGYPAWVTSTANLKFFLEEINAASWSASPETIADWLKAPSAGARGDDMLAAAREGFAAYDALRRFADGQRGVALVSA
jgi:hypothetical protein